MKGRLRASLFSCHPHKKWAGTVAPARLVGACEAF